MDRNDPKAGWLKRKNHRDGHNGGAIIKWKSRGGGVVYAPRKSLTSHGYAVLVRDRAALVRQQQEKESFTQSVTLIKRYI